MRQPRATTSSDPPARPARRRSRPPGAAAAPCGGARRGALPPTERKVDLVLRVEHGREAARSARGRASTRAARRTCTSPRPAAAINCRRHAAHLRPEAPTAPTASKLDNRPRLRSAFVGPDREPAPRTSRATGPNLDVRVGVYRRRHRAQARSSACSPSPTWSDIDKLSWLLLGRASETHRAAPTRRLLQQAALALSRREGPGAAPTRSPRPSPRRGSRSRAADRGRHQGIRSSRSASSSRRTGTSATERGLNATAGSWQLSYRLARQAERCGRRPAATTRST
jgi:translocation and assembly module TamB